MRKATLLFIGSLAIAGTIIAAMLLNTPPTSSVQPVPQRLSLSLVADGLQHPVAVAVADGVPDRAFVVDQIGVVYMLMENGSLSSEPFMDLSERMVALNPGSDERGLLSIAFHPNFAQDRRLFVFYSTPLRPQADPAYDHTNIVSEFRVSNDLVVDMTSERVVLSIDQPSMNHNGGQVLFGPDGLLYITAGDGGGGNDVGLGHNVSVGNGQDPYSVHGKVLRIDVDFPNGSPYSIPADNPFSSGGGLPEIFAWGFRNPAYAAFDPLSGGLFIADAGQARYEEVDLVVKGGNYGWRYREGAHCFDPQDALGNPTSCPNRGVHGEALIDPISEFRNSRLPGGEGRAVIGGAPYHGNITSLDGGYIFGGFESGESPLFVLLPENGTWARYGLALEGQPNGRVPGFLLAVDGGLNGEVLILSADSSGPSGGTGKVWTLITA